MGTTDDRDPAQTTRAGQATQATQAGHVRQSDDARGPADLVFTGGGVYTVDAARSWASAVAVRGGRIVAVGAEHEVGELIGPRTEVVSLRGRLLVPGFQDAHVHPVLAGATLRACDLHALPESDARAYVETVAAYAAANPGREWITGGGWSMEAFPGGTPHRGLLDAVVSDRPVALPNRDGHGLWVNSRALELAGITADTPDPADGRIERDADGSPTGMLQEGAAQLVTRIIPATTAEEFYEGLLEGQRYLHAFGITAWQDAAVGVGFGPGDVYGAYLAAAKNGKLTARVRAAQWWDREAGLEQLAGFEARRTVASVGRLSAGTVKMMLDGVAENHTAAMLEPYLAPGHGDGHGQGQGQGHAPGRGQGHGHGGGGAGCGCAQRNSGLDFIDPKQLPEFVSALDAADFQVHFHALGDRAVRYALDAVEEALRRNGRRGNRHHLAHLQVVHPDDVPRFARLGATANMQPLWACHEPQMDELTIPFLGARRAGWQYPFGSLLRAGAMLAAGSDWSVSTPDVMAGIHVAVNRRGPGEDGPVLGPEERLDLGTAIAAYTAGSARVNHLDAVTGSIEVGKYADLTLLDRDPFAGPAHEIGATRVVGTFVAGEAVYTAP